MQVSCYCMFLPPLFPQFMVRKESYFFSPLPRRVPVIRHLYKQQNSISISNTTLPSFTQNYTHRFLPYFTRLVTAAPAPDSPPPPATASSHLPTYTSLPPSHPPHTDNNALPPSKPPTPPLPPSLPRPSRDSGLRHRHFSSTSPLLCCC